MNARLADLGIRFPREAGTQRTTCPQCSDTRKNKRDPCLAVSFKPDGGVVWFCHHCGWTGGVQPDGGQAGRRKAAPKPKPPKDEDDEATRIAKALRTWNAGHDPRGTLVERYLNGRGLELGDDLAGEVLRFDPARPWYDDGRITGYWPAMLAMMRDVRTDQPCGLHATWLANDGSGKAHVPKPKKMFGRARNAAVKLDPDDDVTYGLGIAEGVETTLAARVRFRPMWALGSAGAIGALEPMPGLEALSIFADADGNGTGQDAARECARRWTEAGCEVVVRTVVGGGDFNDLDMRQGR